MEEKAEREKKAEETRKTALGRKKKERRAQREKERIGKKTKRKTEKKTKRKIERKIERKGEERRVKTGRDRQVLGKEGNENDFAFYYDNKFKLLLCNIDVSIYLYFLKTKIQGY